MINKIIKFSLIASSALTLIFLLLGWGWDAIAFFIGTGWGALNLYLIAQVLQHVLMTKRHGMAIAWLFVKFPILYGTGYLILSCPLWNNWMAAFGLLVIFIGILFSARTPNCVPNP